MRHLFSCPIPHLHHLNDLLIERHSLCFLFGTCLSTQAQDQAVRVRFQCALPVRLADLLRVRGAAEFQDLIVVLRSFRVKFLMAQQLSSASIKKTHKCRSSNKRTDWWFLIPIERLDHHPGYDERCQILVIDQYWLILIHCHYERKSTVNESFGFGFGFCFFLDSSSARHKPRLPILLEPSDFPAARAEIRHVELGPSSPAKVNASNLKPPISQW